jgi:diguanylate cyclase
VPLSAIDLYASQGDAVLHLLERAEVPPLPSFYRLFYDYVAGVDGLLSGRIDSIMAEGPDARQRLYSEFVAPYENSEAVERAIARIVARLQTLEVLIEESVRTSRSQSASLRAATVDLAGAHLDARLLGEWVGRLRSTNDELREANSKLGFELDRAQDELATTRAEIERSRAGTRIDPLTGLVNRAGLDLELSRLLEQQRNGGGELAFAVVDVDHFKTLNDTYGHQAGDEVLRIVSRALLASVRPSDIVGRTGGDEFLVILPSTGSKAALELADRMRRAVVDGDLRPVLGPRVLGGATVSIGLALWRPADSIAAIMERADAALYEAKGRGRNRVVSEDELPV